MKLIVKGLLGLTFLASFSSAATITISPGVAAFGQGVSVTTGGSAAAPFVLAVGGYQGAVFTPFGASFLDTGFINGEVTAQAPTSLNNAVIHLFVGNGGTIAGSTSYMIFRTTTNTAFPPNVALAGGTTFSAALGSGLFTVESFGGSSITGNAVTLAAIPEPSTALLGLLGVIGLVRRRR